MRTIATRSGRKREQSQRNERTLTKTPDAHAPPTPRAPTFARPSPPRLPLLPSRAPAARLICSSFLGWFRVPSCPCRPWTASVALAGPTSVCKHVRNLEPLPAVARHLSQLRQQNHLPRPPAWVRLQEVLAGVLVVSASPTLRAGAVSRLFQDWPRKACPDLIWQMDGTAQPTPSCAASPCGRRGGCSEGCTSYF